MRFIILLVFALFVAESLAQSITTKLFLNKNYQVTITTSDVFYRVNQTKINSSPKTWIDSIFNNNSADSTTLVRVNKYEVSGNDTLLNGKSKNHIQSNEINEEINSFVVESTNQNPYFKKGNLTFENFLVNNIIYPESAREKNITCQVVVTFVVNKDGTVSDIETSNCTNESIVNEAVRIVNLSSGYWIAEEVNGLAVRTKLRIPISFSLD
jgi:TonB family protein